MLLAVQEEAVRRMLAANVRYAAMALIGDTGGCFTVAVHPAGTTGTPPGHGQPVDLPAGPAVLLTTRQTLDGGLIALQRHAVMTQPDTGELLLFSMSTQDCSRVPAFTRLFDDILRTVRFTSSDH